MPLTRSTDRGSVLVRRFSTNRPTNYVGVGHSDIDYPNADDYSSMAGSDPFADSNGDTSAAENLMFDLDEDQQRIKAFNEFANRTLMPDENELMLKKFEKAEDIPFEQTYQLGKPVRVVSQPTTRPHVAIVLLPGADLPEVNRLEQFGMVNDLSDQRDATWRVATAGEMLSNISVTADLHIDIKDVTADVAANAHGRMIKESQGNRSYRALSRHAVTIDSENVEIVHEFTQARKTLDLSATLIEVNVSSLFTLMTQYKQIILGSGAQLTAPKVKQLLDRMIEAAKLFCVRSPILFRMSTRSKIISSNNTRYGVDGEQGFHTFTTSKGIQEIIMMSASYFLALDPSAPGMDSFTQRVIRPRYIQMLTLLLSLLNDDDLKSTAAFLKETYGILPHRKDIELLFLKVIPLT